MSYFNIYCKRVNRFGTDYQSRIQGEREEIFRRYLLKSLYRIEFEYGESMHTGSFERYRQDETETLHYLLTEVSLDMPNGTVLFLPDKNGQEKPWMVYYLEHIKASGYNRYIMLRLTHYLTWSDTDGLDRHSWAYMYGQEDNMLKNEIKSRSKMDTIYSENLKLNFFIMPVNIHLKKDDYLEITQSNITEAYRVTGYDIQSNDGIMFVSVDPVYIRDHSVSPRPVISDSEEDYFWVKAERGEDV